MSLRKVIVMSLSVLLLACFVQAGPKFSLKLYGGPGFWTTGGDFKGLFESTLDRLRSVGYTGTFDLDWKPLSFEGGIQAVAMLTPQFGLAIGVGFLSKSINQDASYADEVASVQLTTSRLIRSVPVSLNLLYLVPAGPARITLSAGASYYSSRFKLEEQVYYLEPGYYQKPNYKRDVLETFDSDPKGAIGFQAGISVEVKLFGPASLCVDALYRIVSFDDIQGTYGWDEHDSWTGGGATDTFTIEQAKMWYDTCSLWGGTYNFIDYYKTQPSNADKARLFKISMDGPVFLIGLKIGL